MRLVSLLGALLFTLALHAAPTMARVTGIENGRTITIERNGTRETIALAGVAIQDDAQARALLRWTIGDAWVMLEPAAAGEFLVYRSPDALFINRELVLRGFAGATQEGIAPDLRTPARYLGQYQPMSAQPQTRVSQPRSQTRSDSSRRSTAGRSRSTRGRAARRAASPSGG